MEDFMKKMGEDKAFKDAFIEYTKKPEVCAQMSEVADALNKYVLNVFNGFLKEQGIECKDSEALRGQVNDLNKQMGFQLNEMVLKQFGTLNQMQKGTRK